MYLSETFFFNPRTTVSLYDLALYTLVKCDIKNRAIGVDGHVTDFSGLTGNYQSFDKNIELQKKILLII